VAALLMTAAGCDLFSTRDAESPDGGRNTWQTPRQPADVLDNMRAALSERDAVNYLRSFESSSFRFEADPVALSHDPFLAEWGYDEESQHISRLLSEGTLPQDSILSLVFLAPEVTMLGDSAIIRTGYELEAGVALAGVPHRVAGTADFRLRIGGGSYWQIHYWQDTRTEDEATWSDFKSLVR
jgi:hypothetical protein